MPLVPLITNSGPTTGLYAPAGSGGGGGGGTVSTFTQLFTSSIVASSIITSDPVANDFSIVGAGGCLIAFDMSSGGLNDIQIFNEDGRGAIGFRNVAPSTSVVAIGGPNTAQEVPVSISTLVCSTINGAVPGGSVSPDLALSSLTMNGTIDMANNTISLDGAASVVYASAGDGNIYVSANKGKSVNVGEGDNLTALVANLSGVSVNGSLTIPGSSPADGSALAITQLSPSGVLFNYVSSATTFAQIEMVRDVNATGNGGVKINGGQDPATLYVGGNKIDLAAQYVGVSSLTVSSINGAAPGGGSGAPQFYSTIGNTTVAAATSSILTEIPLGTCAYSFLGENATNDVVITGMMNLTIDNNGNKFASIGANFNGGLGAALVFPYVDTTTTPGTPLFGIANTSAFILETTGALNRIV